MITSWIYLWVKGQTTLWPRQHFDSILNPRAFILERSPYPTVFVFLVHDNLLALPGIAYSCISMLYGHSFKDADRQGFECEHVRTAVLKQVSFVRLSVGGESRPIRFAFYSLYLYGDFTVSSSVRTVRFSRFAAHVSFNDNYPTVHRPTRSQILRP